MFVKALIGGGIVVAGGYAAYNGQLPFGGPARETRLVAHPVAEVYAAIADMNADTSDSLVPAEGLMNMFIAVPTPAITVEPGRSVRWDFYVGQAPAETIVATLEPAESGAATRIVTVVTDHALPSGVAPPPVSVPGGMKAMFDLALGQKLGALDPALAAQAKQQLTELRNQAAMKATTAVALNPMAVGLAGMKMEREIRAMEKDVHRTEATSAAKHAGSYNPYERLGEHPTVSFKPGQPMIDPSRR